MSDDVEAVWTEVSLSVRPAAAEPVSELLQELTGTGVAIEPPIRSLGPDEGYVLDETAPLVLRAYLYGPVERKRRMRLRRRLSAAGYGAALAGRLRWRTIREEDWAEAWKEHYEVERVGRIVIRPAWREYEAREGEVVVGLDPGMAFGTGQHATTRMCLLALQERLRPGQTVLDLGTGSGILAIAAAALDAGACLALDIETQAVAAARANLALNGLEDRVRVREGSLDASDADEAFDLVLANINAATIIALAPDLLAATKPGGSVVVGGIIAEREAACAETLTGAGFRLAGRLEDGDWRSLVGTRR